MQTPGQTPKARIPLKIHSLGCCIDCWEERRMFTRGMGRPLSDTSSLPSPRCFFPQSGIALQNSTNFTVERFSRSAIFSVPPSRPVDSCSDLRPISRFPFNFRFGAKLTARYPRDQRSISNEKLDECFATRSLQKLPTLEVYGARFRRPSVGSFLAVQSDSPAQ